MILLNYKNIEMQRSMIDYDLDGLVYKVDSLKLQNRLGFISNSPDGQLHINFHQKKDFP